MGQWYQKTLSLTAAILVSISFVAAASIATDNTLEEYIKEKTNIKTIYLACGRVLENAHKFYIKNGFKKIDNLEIEMYTVEGDDFFKKEIK